MNILRATLLLMACTVATATAEQRPNFLFILVDDLGIHDMSGEGSAFHETPNIDRIADAGMRFNYGYSACQVCSPSRAAIQTGKYPARLKITDFIAAGSGGNQPDKWRRNTKLLPARYEMQLPHEEVTVAEALGDAGYKTFFAGKWHLGDHIQFGPESQGYDINKGGHAAGTPPGGYFSPYRNPVLEDGPVGEELPVRLGQETAEFIREHKGEPFFAMLSFYSVHGPIQTSKARWEKYQEKAERMGLRDRDEPRFLLDRTQEVRQVQDHPVYAGMMEAMDEGVGLALQALDETGRMDNTVIIFTSDNGGVSSGDGYATSALPLRGGKGRQWEGGVRQPYYIAWPGVTDGARTNVPASGIDFFPTILDIAGVDYDSQGIDGVSLVPALHGGSIASRSLFWHYPHYGNQGGEPSAIHLKGPWKLIHYYEDGRLELYNIDRDLGEQHNLAKVHPERAQSLFSELVAWTQSVDARFPSDNPNYDAEAYARYIDQVKTQRMPNREAQHAAFLEPDFEPNGGWWETRGR